MKHIAAMLVWRGIGCLLYHYIIQPGCLVGQVVYYSLVDVPYLLDLRSGPECWILGPALLGPALCPDLSLGQLSKHLLEWIVFWSGLAALHNVDDTD